jgi:hypothetical protein
MKYKQILKQAIDLHVHVGPEIIPRKFNFFELLENERGQLGGVAAKNHFFPVVIGGGVKIKYPIAINSITLNHYVGGFNSYAIKSLAEISSSPIIVWFPTIHAKNILENQKFEIPVEWVSPKLRKKFEPRLTDGIKGLTVFNKNEQLSNKVKKVLTQIKKSGAILATGHISWRESQVLIRFATEEIGLKKIIITHPMYQKIDMPIEVQRELVEMGALVEHCFSMHSIDNISIKKIAEQIKSISPENCILSSDVGQSFSPRPSEALNKFIKLLEREGIKEGEIILMLINNPRKLLQ